MRDQKQKELLYVIQHSSARWKSDVGLKTTGASRIASKPQ
jgi:hypothetical protein